MTYVKETAPDIFILSSIEKNTCWVILPPSGTLHKWEKKNNSLDPTPISALIMHSRLPKPTQYTHFLGQWRLLESAGLCLSSIPQLGRGCVWLYVPQFP